MLALHKYFPLAMMDLYLHAVLMYVWKVIDLKATPELKWVVLLAFSLPFPNKQTNRNCFQREHSLNFHLFILMEAPNIVPTFPHNLTIELCTEATAGRREFRQTIKDDLVVFNYDFCYGETFPNPEIAKDDRERLLYKVRRFH